MKIKLQLFLLTFFLIFPLFSQTIWNSYSVSTSDDLNALSHNPAGLGIDRGKQSGLFLISDNRGGIDDPTLYFAHRSNGFGFDISYGQDDKYNFGLGLAGEVSNYINLGLKWNKYDNYSAGLLYRPFNWVSSGYTIWTDHDFKQIQQEAGISFRPFTLLDNDILYNLNFTLGSEVITKDRDSTSSERSLSHFISVTPFFGLELSASFNDDDSQNFQLNLDVNFGKGGVSLSGGENTKSRSIGLYSYSQHQKSDIKKTLSPKPKYIRMDLEGYFIEEKPYEPPFDLNIKIDLLGGNTQKGIQLRTWIDEINSFTEDANIEGMIIDLGNVRAGFAKRGEMRDALLRFKNAGKKIIVHSNHTISNMGYYLISMADEIYLHEMNGVDLKGLNMEVTFIRGLLDSLSIVPEVFRISPYKTAGDLVLNSEMSDEMHENYSQLLDDYYEIFAQDISVNKSWDIDSTKAVIDNGPYFSAKSAMNANLITDIKYPDEFEEYIETLEEEFNIVKWDDIDRSDEYVHDWVPVQKPKIAIVYAVGGIVSGESNPGIGGSTSMGDETIKEAIKSARENEDVKAIVFRIDSGGGSALASDMMWKEIHNTTVTDSSNAKPFIASMSDVAASGGYYIACQADTIVADASTLTGSIGVIGLNLNFSQLLNKIGINFGGIKRGEHADFSSQTRLITEEEREIIMNRITDIYNIFKQRVIDGRENLNDLDSLDNIALGRIWSGQEALDNGLIDKIGGLHDAIDIAKATTGLADDEEFDIIEYPKHDSGLFSKIELNATSDFNQYIPKQIKTKINALNVIPILLNDDLQLIIPMKIDIQ